MPMPPPPRGRPEDLPGFLPPMLAESERHAPESGYAFEYKWDGVRTLARCDHGSLTLFSRNGRDVTFRYPELAPLAKSLSQTQALLDGEIVAVDRYSRPSFSQLQRRMHLNDAGDIERLRREVPVVYMVFDLLHLAGASTRELHYTDRRGFLERLDLNGEHYHTPPVEYANGSAMLASARQNGIEGVIAKRPDGTYRPGLRAKDWLKIKIQLRQEFVIGGYLPGQGSIEGAVGALLVGYYEHGRLKYAGGVGTGFSHEERANLRAVLDQIVEEKNPFHEKLPKEARFSRPVLVAEIEFLEWTPDGHLRHPVYRGVRTDKDPHRVVREAA